MPLEEFAAVAAQRDAADASLRDAFFIPPDHSGSGFEHVSYMAGNSLGLQPRATRNALLGELDDWAEFGVEGHLEGAHPWFSYHELLRADLAKLVGARESEVVAMNTLTVNLHLLMAAFYKPTKDRFKILIEDRVFSSDSYAVRSQVRMHGLDPDTAVVRLKPRDGEDCLRTEDILTAISENSIALTLCSAVGYLTGELLDLKTITDAAHASGAVVGWDLAHAAGNVELNLHDLDTDFAAWCTYKYLNSGPGAVAGAFIHDRHAGRSDLTRLEGWWSTRADTRFEMNPVSSPPATADAWAISNPPIFSLAPVRISARMFADVGMSALRARSVQLTGFLEEMLNEIGATIITPSDPSARGAQLSVRVADASATSKRLRHEHGVIADARKPDIIRLAPAPMYCSFTDCWRAAISMIGEKSP